MSITISSPVEFEFLTTDNFISPAIPFGTLNMGSFDAKWSGTFNGTVYIEGTDTNVIPDPTNPPSSIDWVPLILTTIVGGLAPDSSTFWFTEIFSSTKFLRFRFAYSTGSGSMKVIYNAKSFG